MTCKHMTRRTPFALVVLFLALASSSLAQDNSSDPTGADHLTQVLILKGVTVGRAVETHGGEICMVCNKPVGQGDLTYLVKGQRVPVHRSACDGQLRANPTAVLAQLRPRGAFLGAETEQPGLASRWFVFGLYVLIGLCFGALCAHSALHSGQNPVVWFLVGLAFNVLGYAVLRSRPRLAFPAPAGIPAGFGKIPATRTPATCAKCGAAIHPSAASCPDCGADQQPTAISEVALAMGVK